MSERNLPQDDHQGEHGENDEGTHPLKAGIEAAKNGDTASLDEILAMLD